MWLNCMLDLCVAQLHAGFMCGTIACWICVWLNCMLDLCVAQLHAGFVCGSIACWICVWLNCMLDLCVAQLHAGFVCGTIACWICVWLNCMLDLCVAQLHAGFVCGSIACWICVWLNCMLDLCVAQLHAGFRSRLPFYHDKNCHHETDQEYDDWKVVKYQYTPVQFSIVGFTVRFAGVDLHILLGDIILRVPPLVDIIGVSCHDKQQCSCGQQSVQ